MLNPHEHVGDHLDDYLDHALSPTDVAILERHCERCEACRSAMEEAKGWRAVPDAFAAADAISEARWDPPRKPTRTPAASRARRDPPPTGARLSDRTWGILRRCWAATAVAAAVLVASGLYYNHLSPSPLDLQLLGQSEWLPGSDAAIHLRLVRHEGNRGMGGVPVAVDLVGPRSGQVARLARVTTGPDGAALPRVRLPEWDDGDYQLRVVARPGRATETITRTIRLRRSWRLMLSTDRPVYRPGQVIRMRGLALRRPDLKPVAGREIAFSVADPKGNVVFRARGLTGEFGIGASECPLADELIEGPYQVECRVGEVTGRATVEVKTYVLPRVKVAIETDRPFYTPGAPVRARVRAEYYHGQPVAGGTATIALATEGDGSKVLQGLDLALAGDGTASFELAPPRSIARGPDDARVAITATVRDAAGQSQSRTVSRVISANPIRIEVIPEAGTLVAGLPNTIHFLTSLPDGGPAPSRLRISSLGRELSTDEMGVASLEITPGGDPLAWTVEAHDDEGRVGRRDVTLECGGRAGDYLVRTDRAVYRGGESLRVSALGVGAEPVFLDLIRDGQTVLSESIAMARGRGELTLDLPPELSGTIELCAYRYDSDGSPIRKSRVIYVRPARGVAIRTRLDRDEYRPGERARLTIDLADERGKPVPGAVSLSAVDEAVFGVIDRRPGLERTFFSLERELLEPVYQIRDWSPDAPVVGPPEARERFEQALFARTARLRGVAEVAASLRLPPEEFGDGSRILRVLERPDWEELARTVDLSDAMLDMLRRAGAPHTLAASTFPAKVADVLARQRIASSALGAGWAFVVLFALALAIVSLWGLGWGELLLGLTVLGTLGLCLLPAVNSAREAGRRTQALNDLRNLALAGAAPGAAAAPGGEAPARVRQWFPETLLWRPELITDDRGHASLDLDLADSITTWRLSAAAVTGQGRLGGADASIRVFQPFFVDLDLPATLTRGDEVAVPVVVSNYLEAEQLVALTLDDAPGFERLDGPETSLTLGPGEVRAAHYRIRAKAVGHHTLLVRARGQGAGDAVRREVEVVPEGRRVEQVSSGTLRQPVAVDLDVPGTAIPGSVKALVKIYPTSFGQLVEGLDSIFRLPYGCFEQASSTTYPNVLALDYLGRTRQSVPAVEARARGYIHLGYQRLLGFEVAGGGFDWFGNPPANRTLTAYGLMEFEDMARVHDVDPALIARTRRWLLDQRDVDGSWAPEGHRLAEDPTRGGDARLGATAYIAWAVFSGHADDPAARTTLGFLRSRAAGAIDDPYLLALLGNALLALDPAGCSATPYLDRLVDLARTSDDGKFAWWEGLPARRTLFHGAGECGTIETTAMACLALLSAGRAPETTRGALAWLIARKDAQGTWQSTQATVLALKALLAGTGEPLGDGGPRRVALVLDGGNARVEDIPADQADVVRQVDLSGRIGPGPHRLTLDALGGSEPGYQVVLSYHMPDEASPRDAADEPLRIDLAFDRTTLTVGERVTATSTVLNRRSESSPMVVLDLPIPAGFALEGDDLAGALASGTVAKYQLTPRNAVLYLRGLEPGRPLTLRYRLRATMPAELTVPPARAYEYYDPGRRGASPPSRLRVLTGG